MSGGDDDHLAVDPSPLRCHCGKPALGQLDWCSDLCRANDSSIKRLPISEAFAIFTRAALEEDVGYESPLCIPCVRCGGSLAFDGLNLDKTRAFIKCRGECGHTYVVNVC